MSICVEGGPIDHIYPDTRMKTALSTACRFSRNTDRDIVVSIYDRNEDPKIRPVAVFRDDELIWTEEDEDDGLSLPPLRGRQRDQHRSHCPPVHRGRRNGTP